MQELADAINIPLRTIGTFFPDDLRVREKLRLASTRNAAVEEDDAYSLIGIFKSDIRPHYGKRADALRGLLEDIVTPSIVSEHLQRISLQPTITQRARHKQMHHEITWKVAPSGSVEYL
ncbi:hypothetical protein EDC04DRAFT_744456 [Pisolithus marmoratus]|nr:hypothetical protein EDC04DRAFT_744456 [Pisolithus marmoratus]